MRIHLEKSVDSGAKQRFPPFSLKQLPRLCTYYRSDPIFAKASGEGAVYHLVLASERLFGKDLGPFEIGTEILNKNLNLKTAIRVRTKFGCLKQKCQSFRADLEPVELLVCK
jgi:hypothetical protein